MAKIVILRAFNIKNVASPIYALLSVIRQQMSPFDPFRGGGVAKRGQCPLYLPFFFRRASLNYRDKFVENLRKCTLSW